VRAKPYTAPPFYPAAPQTDPTVKAVAIPGYYQVREYTCGYAATLMVLHAFRRYVPGRELYERLGTDHYGTSQSAIVRELRAAGIGVNLRYDLDFDRLRREIDRDRLVIGYHHRLEHWVVLYGYGVEPERVFVADPLRHMRNEHSWERYGPKLRGFGIVCTRRRRRVTRPGVEALGHLAARADAELAAS